MLCGFKWKYYLCQNFEGMISITNKAHKDNPKFFSGCISDAEAHSFNFRDYNFIIQ